MQSKENNRKNQKLNLKKNMVDCQNMKLNLFLKKTDETY